MKTSILFLSILGTSLLLFEVCNGQSLTSPFVALCRRSCGGYGIFRRMCCMVDDVCCTKPNECPEDPTQNILIRMCQSCTTDVDCFFYSKCCESDGKKCCTSVRSSFFRKSGSERSKIKPESTGTSKVTTAAIEDEEDNDATTAATSTTAAS